MIDNPQDCNQSQQQHGQTSPSQSVKTTYTLQETCQTSPDKSRKNSSSTCTDYDKQVKRQQSVLAKLCSCLNMLQTKKSKEELASMNVIKEFAEGVKEMRGPVEVPFQDEDDRGKKTLVLDLDETLVTSSCLEFPSADLIIKVNLQDGRGKNIWVKFRPGAQAFLREMSELYEIIIFTASIREYASAVIDFLDVQSNVSLRLFRENCSQDSHGGFFKDIRKIHREIGNIIIIDNQASQFKKSPDNGILISDFKIDNHNDCELVKLIPFLKFMSGVKDVRSVSKYMAAYMEGQVINYIDINDMENQFQKGAIIYEDRLATEKTESKIDQVDIEGFQEEENDESSTSGNTIRLESRDYYKKQPDALMMRHFEDDIDAAMKIQEDINQKQNDQQSKEKLSKSKRHNQFLSSFGGSGSSRMTKTSFKGNDNSQRNSIKQSKNIQELQQQITGKTQPTNTKESDKLKIKKATKNIKNAFDFSSFKSSVYNKLTIEKENIQVNSNAPDNLIIAQTCTSPENLIFKSNYDENTKPGVQDLSLNENISKGFIDTNQTQNADNSNNFIIKPHKSYKKQPHQRRCVSQAIPFAEVSLQDENYNSPINYKEI